MALPIRLCPSEGAFRLSVYGVQCLSPGADSVIPNMSPTPSLDYEDRLGNGVQVSVVVLLWQLERF